MNAAQNLIKTARRTFTLKDLIHHEKYQYKNLIEMISEYPNHGVGFRIAKIYWPENQWIQVLRVDLETNRIGKVFGKKYVEGTLASDNLLDVQHTTTRGLWRYDLGDSMCILDKDVIYTISDLEKHYKTVKQRSFKRPADLRKNMVFTPPGADPIENTNYSANYFKAVAK